MNINIKKFYESDGGTAFSGYSEPIKEEQPQQYTEVERLAGYIHEIDSLRTINRELGNKIEELTTQSQSQPSPICKEATMSYKDDVAVKFPNPTEQQLEYLIYADAIIRNTDKGEDPIAFAEWIIQNRYVWEWDKEKYVPAWNNYTEYTATELYQLFKNKNS